MRIVHVTDTFAPTLGGIEVFVEQLARRQRAAGHDAVVVTRTPGGASVGPIPVVRADTLAAEVVAGADVVHCHASVWSPLVFRSITQATGAGVPVLVTVHSLWRMPGWSTYLSVFLRGWAATWGWADAPAQWAAVSSRAARPVQGVLDPYRGVLVLPNAVDAAAWAPRPRTALEDEVVLVATMRMAHRKRPVPLVDMLADARAEVPEHVRMRVVLVGDGAQLPKVRARLTRLGMDTWVNTPGTLDHRALHRLYARADAFLAPSDLESFGIAALEARTSGLAVIGKRRTGIADFVTSEVDGLLADTDADMTAAIARFCSDSGLRERLVTHSRSVDPGFDWTEALARHDAAYAEAALALHEGRHRVREPSLSGV